MGQDHRHRRVIGSVMDWTGAKPLGLTVDCEGGRHSLRLDGSTLELIDHPDLDAELAMIAFGGAEPACVALHRLWFEATADGGFLAEWVDETRMSQAWFSWLAMALDRMRAEGFHEFLRRLPPARAQRMGEFLHRFPTPWIDRAAAVVSETIFEGDGVECAHAAPLISTAISNRLRRAFVDAVGGRQLAVGAAALVPLTISTAAAELPVADGMLRGDGRGVAITVSKTWLHRVWAVDAAVIDGQLVLALEPTAPPDTEPAEGEAVGAPGRATVVGWRAVDRGGHQPFIETKGVGFRDGRWTGV